MVINGHCPTLNKDHSIYVEYQDITTIDMTSRKSMKGFFECELASFGKCPTAKECPLYKSAPEYQ